MNSVDQHSEAGFRDYLINDLDFGALPEELRNRQVDRAVKDGRLADAVLRVDR